MRKIIHILTLAIFLYSCEKYPEPGTETLERFQLNYIGNLQSAKVNTYLPNKVGAQIDLAYTIPQINATFRMEISVTLGDGSVDKSIIEADEDGKMITQWKMGNDQNKQELTCRVFDDTNKLHAEFTLEATAFFDDKLNEITRGYLVGIHDMVRDTSQQLSMMLSGASIYVNNSSTLLNWSPIHNYSLPNIKELEVNSKGHVYAAAWNGELFRSKNWGMSWDYLGKPIPNNRYHYELTITNDDYIWANKWEHGVYCSKDAGLTWQKDTLGLSKQEELGRIFSFADTSHMAVSYANLTIHKTDDDGLTWYPINTPEYSQSMFITNENAIIAQNQNGFNLHKSTDGGNTYQSVFRAIVAFGTTSRHCFDKFKNDYYILAPGGGVWKTKDFENYEKLMRFDLQRNLFIDHNGTIYASGFNYSNATPDPTYVLPPHL